MPNHLKVITGSSATSQAIAVANLNTALAAEIVAAAPQDVSMVATSSAMTVDYTTGSTTYLFIAGGLVQFVG